MTVKLIEKLNSKISSAIGVHHLDISAWGNDLADSFQCNYEFQHYADSFLSVGNGSTQSAKIFLIVGPINLIQIEKIKLEYQKVESQEKYIIYVKGSLHKAFLKNSVTAIENPEDHLPVALKYMNYPIDIEDLLGKIILLKDEKHAV